jgi:arylformamidase
MPNRSLTRPLRVRTLLAVHPEELRLANSALKKVWRDLDQTALNNAYDQPVYASNFQYVAARMATNSQLMRARRGEAITYSYGPLDVQKLHYYPARTQGHPVMLHVRGGSWRRRSAQDVAFPAEYFNAAGIGFAVFDFNGVEETAGNLTPLLAQVVEAMAWLPRHARELGGDPKRLFVSGFSSGAHLAAVALTSDWKALGYELNPYKAAVLVSGMYDMLPVRLSSRSTYVCFTDEIEHRMSAQRHLDKLDLPILLTEGMRPRSSRGRPRSSLGP